MMKVIGLELKNCSAWKVTNNLGALSNMYSVVVVGLGQISKVYDCDEHLKQKPVLAVLAIGSMQKVDF